jgi:hypothetical protein
MHALFQGAPACHMPPAVNLRDPINCAPWADRSLLQLRMWVAAVLAGALTRRVVQGRRPPRRPAMKPARRRRC